MQTSSVRMCISISAWLSFTTTRSRTSQAHSRRFCRCLSPLLQRLFLVSSEPRCKDKAQNADVTRVDCVPAGHLPQIHTHTILSLTRFSFLLFACSPGSTTNAVLVLPRRAAHFVF